MKIINEGFYSKINIENIRDILNEFEIPSEKITFPVRAGLLNSPESQGNIMRLLSEVAIFKKSNIKKIKFLHSYAQS